MIDPFDAASVTEPQGEAESTLPVVSQTPTESPPPSEPDHRLATALAKIEMMTEALKVIVMELERSETQASMSRTKIALAVAKASIE
jgi:hypothetical protein